MRTPWRGAPAIVRGPASDGEIEIDALEPVARPSRSGELLHQASRGCALQRALEKTAQGQTRRRALVVACERREGGELART